MEPTRKRGAPRTDAEQGPAEHDKGYGASHGYGPGHGGPSGPGDVPGDETRRPRRNVVPHDEAEKGDGEPARPSETGPTQG